MVEMTKIALGTLGTAPNQPAPVTGRASAYRPTGQLACGMNRGLDPPLFLSQAHEFGFFCVFGYIPNLGVVRQIPGFATWRSFACF
jgi:hypothetical protein